MHGPARMLLVACCGVLGLAPGTHGQSTDQAPDSRSVLRTSWTIADGLPQSSVTALLQTADGYLWIGTSGGLARFDGVAFTVFATVNAPELKSDRILSLFQDHGGTIWIGVEHSATARYRNGAFLAPLADETGVWSIAETPDGDVWLASPRGVTRMRGDRVVERYSQKNGLPGADTHALLADPDGTLWIGNVEGVLRLKNGALTPIPIAPAFSHNVRSLHRARDGTLWVGMYVGLARLEGDALIEVDASLHNVASIAHDDRGIWVASADGLVNVHDGVAIRYSTDDGLGDMKVRSVAVDTEGNLWIGTATAGLARWRARPVTFFTQSDGLAAKGVLPIFQDSGGRIWAGGACGGLSRYEHGVWTAFAEKDGLYDLCVLSIAEDRDGRLWLGTSWPILFSDGRFTRWTDAPDLPRKASIYAIYRDRAGTLWLGTSRGLHHFDGARFTTIDTTSGLVNNSVRFITEDRSGGLWVGTVGGASRISGGRATNYTTANGLSNEYVRAIYEDPDGVIWIGTYGGGLDRLKDGRIVAITTRNGLFDNVVSAILDDGSGNLWMSGNRGIFRASRRELTEVADGRASTVTSVGYGIADGMTVSETNGGAQPAGVKASDGRLWFPTIGGIAVIDPARALNRVPPPVVVEQVSIDGRPSTGTTSEIQIPPGTRALDIRYTALSLTAPEKIRFRYALEGYDPGWIEAGARRVAYYTSLPPGRYRFRVIASNNDGVWNETGAAVNVRQRPHFYQTLWFGALGALALAGAAATGYRVRLRHLVRRTRELEAHVAARTAEVVERSDQLATANAQLGQLNHALASAHDDLLSTLNEVSLGVALVTEAGDVTFVNDRARRLLEIDSEAAVHKPWNALLPLHDDDRLQLEALAALPQARRSRLPARIDTTAGRSYWMEIEVRDDPRGGGHIFCLHDLTELYDLRRLLDDKAQFHGLIGQSAAMQLVVKQIRDLAAVDATVLIDGETGTGKELVARAIHYASRRKARAFVAVNSAGLTESLLASTLFGHRRGAFTGAVADQIGLFESAEAGTIFLDEIGDIPLPIQTSLLRVLQEREITRVGENRPHKIDVRVVAATHRDLAHEVRDGRFREDLLYRVRVTRIHVPPLRQRREDIPLLVAWFLGQARTAARREVLEISHEAMDLLLDYRWPGNVRELKSAIESAAVRAMGTLIQPGDLPPEVLCETAAVSEAGPLPNSARREIVDALSRAKGNRAAAARLLGIGRATLYRRMRALGIEDETV